MQGRVGATGCRPAPHVISKGCASSCSIASTWRPTRFLRRSGGGTRRKCRNDAAFTPGKDLRQVLVVFWQRNCRIVAAITLPKDLIKIFVSEKFPKWNTSYFMSLPVRGCPPPTAKTPASLYLATRQAVELRQTVIDSGRRILHPSRRRIRRRGRARLGPLVLLR